YYESTGRRGNPLPAGPPPRPLRWRRRVRTPPGADPWPHWRPRPRSVVAAGAAAGVQVGEPGNEIVAPNGTPAPSRGRRGSGPRRFETGTVKPSSTSPRGGGRAPTSTSDPIPSRPATLLEATFIHSTRRRK